MNPPPASGASIVAEPDVWARLESVRVWSSYHRSAGLEDKKMNVKYAVIFEQAQSNWTAYVPDLPGCITTGGTLDETKQNIREAILGHLETLASIWRSHPCAFEPRRRS